MFAQSQAVGGLEGMLQVGDQSSLRPLIDQQLEVLPVTPGFGHDTQIFYSIGLDLHGDEVPALLDHGGYRYRRILLPALASGLGLWGGRTLLWALVIVSGTAAAVSSGAVAATAVRRDLSDYLALVVVLNPGVWLSVRLMTSDVLALAFMSLGLLAVASAKRGAAVSFALSGLSKDVFLATPVGLWLRRPRSDVRVLLAPILVLVIWMAVVTLMMGDGFTGRGNISLPFVGIAEGSANWPKTGIADRLYTGFALASVVAGLLAAVFKDSWVRYSIGAWALLGVVSSSWVWDFGNNSARVFLAIPVLVALSFGREQDSIVDNTADQPPTISRKNLPV